MIACIIMLHTTFVIQYSNKLHHLISTRERNKQSVFMKIQPLHEAAFLMLQESPNPQCKQINKCVDFLVWGSTRVVGLIWLIMTREIHDVRKFLDHLGHINNLSQVTFTFVTQVTFTFVTPYKVTKVPQADGIHKSVVCFGIQIEIIIWEARQNYQRPQAISNVQLVRGHLWH